MLNNVVRNILRHYPFLTPRASLLRVLPSTPMNFGPIDICDGLKIDAYPGGSADYVVKSLFWLGSFDPWVCSTLKQLVVPGTIAIDIGANIGLMTMIMSQVAGPTGRVHCFEPAPDTCARLRSNVAANLLANVETHEIAISNRVGLCHLVVPEGQNGMARLLDTEEQIQGIEVPMTTFDTWANSHQLGRISVCKIDVEGHEPQVLEGMNQTLNSGMIDSIVFEDHVSSDKSQTQRTLISHGFQIHRIFKTLRQVHFARPNDTAPGKPTADYVATRENSEASRVITRHISSCRPNSSMGAGILRSGTDDASRATDFMNSES